MHFPAGFFFFYCWWNNTHGWAITRTWMWWRPTYTAGFLWRPGRGWWASRAGMLRCAAASSLVLPGTGVKTDHWWRWGPSEAWLCDWLGCSLSTALLELQSCFRQRWGGGGGVKDKSGSSAFPNGPRQKARVECYQRDDPVSLQIYSIYVLCMYVGVCEREREGKGRQDSGEVVKKGEFTSFLLRFVNVLKHNF